MQVCVTPTHRALASGVEPSTCAGMRRGSCCAQSFFKLWQGMLLRLGKPPYCYIQSMGNSCLPNKYS